MSNEKVAVHFLFFLTWITFLSNSFAIIAHKSAAETLDVKSIASSSFFERFSSKDEIFLSVFSIELSNRLKTFEIFEVIWESSIEFLTSPSSEKI